MGIMRVPSTKILTLDFRDLQTHASRIYNNCMKYSEYIHPTCNDNIITVKRGKRGTKKGQKGGKNVE